MGLLPNDYTFYEAQSKYLICLFKMGSPLLLPRYWHSDIRGQDWDLPLVIFDQVMLIVFLFCFLTFRAVVLESHKPEIVPPATNTVREMDKDVIKIAALKTCCCSPPPPRLP